MQKPITKYSLMAALALSLVACSQIETVVKEEKTNTNEKHISMSGSPLIEQYLDYKSKNIDVEENVIEEKRPYIEQVDSVLSEKTLNYIWLKSKENDFSYELILALIKHESEMGTKKINYNKDGSVDKGLMQINSRNVYVLSKLAHIQYPDPMNDRESVDMAFALLNYERSYWKNKNTYSEEQIFFLTILSYNLGSPRVPKFLHRYGWNSDYVDLILKYKNEFEKKAVS